MLTKQDFTSSVNDFFSGTYTKTSGLKIPDIQDIAYLKNAKEMELTMLFVDIRHSTQLVDGFRRQTSAKMYQAFLWGITKIVLENTGQVRSFNGDGVLAVFAGTNQCNLAVRAALKMNWYLSNVLKPKVDAYLRVNQSSLVLDFGIGVHTGTVLVVRGGVVGQGNNDLVWVGGATNYAVKLSSQNDSFGNVSISERIYKALSDDLKFMQSPMSDQTGTYGVLNQLFLRQAVWTQAPLNVSALSDSPVYRTKCIIEP